MRSTLWSVVWLLLWVTSCEKKQEAVTDKNPSPSSYARVSLDWAGTYEGVLPCADCEGIETRVTLSYDGTYTIRQKYLGTSENVFQSSGTFSWNEAGNTVTLPSSPTPNSYFVGENRLFHLGMDGERITGNLAELYTLEKIE